MSFSSVGKAERLRHRGRAMAAGDDVALAQPSCTSASPSRLLPDPFMKGDEPRSPICLSGSSGAAKSWGLISGGREESSHEARGYLQLLCSSPHAGVEDRCRSKEEEYFGEGGYQNALQSSSLAANIKLASFLGELQGVQLCLEGRLDRTCVMDSVKSFQ